MAKEMMIPILGYDMRVTSILQKPVDAALTHVIPRDLNTILFRQSTTVLCFGTVALGHAALVDDANFEVNIA